MKNSIKTIIICLFCVALSNAAWSQNDVPVDAGNVLKGRPVSGTAPTSGQVLKWDGTKWSPATDDTGGGGSGWQTTGNSGLTSPKLGTTDAVAVSVRTNDVERINIASDGVLTTTLKDNVSSGGTIGSTGLTNLMEFVTTDALEKVDVNGTLEASTLVTESANNATTKQVVRITTGGTVALPAGVYDGEVKTLVNKSGGAVTIDPTSTITILGASTYSLADGTAITVRYVTSATDWEMYSVGATSLPAAAGGSSGQVQYNSGGSLAGNASFTYAPGATTGDEVLITANSISSGNGLDITSNSTAATGNTQTLAKIALSGANASSSQTTYALDVANTHTGTTSTNVGIRADASGGTDNVSIALGANSTQVIRGERRTSDAGGSDLRIQAGGSFSGGSNRAGGNLLLSGGISTGSTGSEIQFLTATNSGSGTADRNPTLKAVINRSGFLGVGTSSPATLLHLSSSGNAQQTVTYGASNYAQFLYGDATSNKWSFEILGKTFSSQYQNIFGIYQYKDRAEATVNKYRMFIADDGDVGFGVDGENNVVSKVQVRGNGTTSSTTTFLVENSAGTQGLRVRDDGVLLGRHSDFLSSGLFSATGTATVANTTTETTLLGTVSGTKTLPTNLFTAGKKVTVRVTGTIGSTASAPTLNIRLKFGSTTIAETGAQTIGTDIDGNRRFVAEFEVTCRSTGASGTLQAGGEFRYFDGSTGEKAMEAAENLVSSFNTTTTHVVDVTATWGTADAANTISGTQATLIIED